ncbi:BaiN/RdsA family NAD(P)/FAD-dependent oxidoreductase [Chlorobium phaeobacteroides]|uniref:HI0933 family protein n=1 Tax=Chlorobium phaeobacteroides (strain DSM 266 / SMG 266 / 2430) TaxID=290317 RepID=A1BGQ6_CHLPD|nr:aminoacetone oxidase family FAD-binding enzyme [Chlorobium phaeobacteroides]ABL65583.1 HI0933 family protein [Chlorobium phaeobacteroides DSM 266]
MALKGDLLIVGGGASGMLAALGARDTLRNLHIPDDAFTIILLERNARQGAKLRISGGGKCNVTHEGESGELLLKGFFDKAERRFLKHSFFSFTNSDLCSLLDRYGVKTAARPDGKVFPVSERAADVLKAFEAMLLDAGINMISSCRASALKRDSEQFTVDSSRGQFNSSALILAVGGVSYATTGTTGDGLAFARKFGHSVIDPSPALAPVVTKKVPPADLVGVSLRSVTLFVSVSHERVERRGDVLITHRGLTGPAVLSLSRQIAKFALQHRAAELYVDLFPAHTSTELQELFLQHARKNGTQMVRKFLQSAPIAPPSGSFAIFPYGTIPTALVPFIMRHAALEPDVRWSELKKDERKSLLDVLKRFPMGTVKSVPLDEGEVSAGGIALKEVNPKTMESRLVPGLYCCGELLDYAGEIGGFNLQAAFSTGWTAGRNAAERLAGGKHPNAGSSHLR